MSVLLMVLIVIVTFFFADSIFTPLILLLWKKIWLVLLKVQTLFTKKNLLQALIQSVVLAGKALLRLINKTVTAWILPLLLTRRQRYRLHHALIDIRRWLRWRALRGWARWRRQPVWFKVFTALPAALLLAALFIASGFLLAAAFGVSFVIPWIGGLPIAALLLFRRSLARLGLFVLERLGVGVVVNKIVDWTIDMIWWRTPEPVQRRFDAWWRRFKMRLRRRVIGPRRNLTRRMARFRYRPTQAGGGADQNEGEPTPPRPTSKGVDPRSAPNDTQAACGPDR